MAFDIDELFIQFNKASCYEHMGVGVNIYLHWCVSLLGPGCAVCLRVCVFVWNQIRVPAKKHITCKTSGSGHRPNFQKGGAWHELDF